MNRNFIDLRNVHEDYHYMIIDDRYIPHDDFGENGEVRLVITYGPNITKEMAGGILAPPLQKGKFVFGVHMIAVEDSNRIKIVDSWTTSYPDLGVEKLEEITKRAKGLLAKMSDEQYARSLREYQKTYTAKDVKVRPVNDPQYCHE